MSLTGRSAGDLAAAVAAGEATAAEVAAAHLDRADRQQPRLNAFTSLDPERTSTAARRVDGRPAPGPLAGVPVTVKDLIDEQGVTTTAGSGFYRQLASHPSPAVARLEAAGAVMLGRAGLHEFAFGFSSENHWFGPVRNPWDPATSPGGSSGGSAAAVAAGVVPVALGTDTGGSVRVPAALCGIVGLKVTHGRVPTAGVFPLAPSLDSVGPLARTVADAALVYGVIAGDEPADPWSAPGPVDLPEPGAAIAGLRIGVPVPWADDPVAEEIAAAFRRALDQFADAGAVVEEVAAPVLGYPGMLTESFAPEVASVHRHWFSERRAGYGPDIAARLEGVFAVSPDQHEEARAWRAAVRHAFDRALEGRDLLATPATAVRRKVIGDELVELRDRRVSYRPELSRFSALVNQGGHPALALPLAWDGPGPAPSLQLIAPWWAEHRLLAAGMAMESAGIAGFRPPP